MICGVVDNAYHIYYIRLLRKINPTILLGIKKINLFTKARIHFYKFTAIRTMDKQDLIQKAKEEVLRQNGGKYTCPLRDLVKPPIGQY